MNYATDYEHISPTAKLVADLRRFSNIPFAEEIAERIGASMAVIDVVGKEHLDQATLRWLAPLVEARYQSLVEAIKNSGCRQVLEFAAGFSFRGAAMTSHDDGLRYVETDLPEIHLERTKLLEGLEEAGGIRHLSHLIFAPVNLMKEHEVKAVEDLLDPGQPVAIVHEGLFQYLSHEEKREAALRIKHILERHGGVWLTPDFDRLDDAMDGLVDYPQLAQIGAFLAQATRRDVVRNAFKNEAQLEEFLDELGFDWAVTKQIDGSYELTSAKRLGTTPEQLEALTRSRRLWWMKPRKLAYGSGPDMNRAGRS
jgi:O-methyltransferase involved in polyketide biosynthesis